MIPEILEILIVEDNIIIQQFIELCLLSLGYAVCGKVASGEAAIDFVKKKKPDAVLMDITLDGTTDGIDAAIAMKKSGPIPIIFLTSLPGQKILNGQKRYLPTVLSVNRSGIKIFMLP